MIVPAAGRYSASPVTPVETGAIHAATDVDITLARERVLETVDHFIAAWCSGAVVALKEVLAADVCLHSDQHGTVQGAAETSAALCADLTLADSLRIEQSNVCVSGTLRVATFSSYIHGELRTDPLFPAMTFAAAITCELHAVTTGWCIVHIGFATASVAGRCELAPHWRCFTSDDTGAVEAPQAWCARDAHLLWPHVRGSDLSGSPEERVIAALSRFAWSLDHNDTALMSTCFHEEARAELPDGDHVAGCYAIVQRLGLTRMVRAWRRHFMDVVTIAVDDAKGTARMLVARIVPMHRYAHDGMPIYDAYFALTARRSWRGVWRFDEFRYVPGWIHMRQLWHVGRQMGLVEA